jgi:hypothetical protein
LRAEYQRRLATDDFDHITESGERV